MKRSSHYINHMFLLRMYPFLFLFIAFIFPLTVHSKDDFITSPETKRKTEAPPTDFRIADPVKNISVKNMYKLSSDLYRSGQPKEKGFKELEKLGVKSVLNLREYHTDNDEAEDTSIKLYRIALAAGSLTREELLSCMQTIEKAPKPVLIHCWHGSDRTGAVCATYRIIKQNWSVDEAVKELINGPYGHHKSTYKNIPELLKSIDWKEFRKDLLNKRK